MRPPHFAPSLSLRPRGLRLLWLAGALALSGCWWDDDKPATTSTEAVVDSVVDADLAIAVATPEYWPTVGWEEAAPELHGFPADAFDSLAADAEEALPYYTSMLVIKDGYLLHESYFDGTPPLEDEAEEAERINQLRDAKHHVYSISKSVTSMTFGVAWTRGDITRLDVTAGDTFSATEMGAMPAGDPRLGITPMHALQMRSGLAWNENAWLLQGTKDPLLGSFSKPACIGSPNTVLCSILQQPSAYTPGTTWNYSTYDTYLAAAFFAKMTGQSVGEYAQQHLFTTLGIEEGHIIWPNIPAAPYTFGGGLLNIRSRDLAKLGMLMLHNGKWDGMQLISPEWMNMSLNAQGAGTLAAFGDDDEPLETGAAADIRYGLQWWRKTGPGMNGLSAITARGLGGQQMHVFRDKNLIVLITCNGDFAETPEVDRSAQINDFIRTKIIEQLPAI